MPHAVTPEELQRIANAGWPAPVTESIGDWVLRAACGVTGRANSALAAGDPGVGFDEALAGIRRFYARYELPAQIQCIVGSPLQATLSERAWTDARPAEADTLVQVAALADLVAAAGSRDAAVALTPRMPDGWLADDSRVLAHQGIVRTIMEAPALVAFASVVRDGHVVAKGRASLCGPWVGITDMWVDPTLRRRGLATAVMAGLIAWAGGEGASLAYLQVVASNAPACAAYERLGFRTHHAYRYLVAPTG